MTAFGAHAGSNQELSVVGVVGTLGTSDTQGTAQVLPIAIDPTTGAQHVNVINGTVTTTLAINSGTLSTLGTVGSVANIGTLPNLNIASGTINVGTFNNTGTNVNIVTGSLVGTVLGGTLQNLASGTINAIAAGTITTGTVSVTTGTVGGKAASGAAAVANPVQIAGTDGGGTIYSPLVSTAGVLTTNLTSSGTLLNLATGTLANSGTTTGVGTVTNLGSVTNVGTIKEVTTVPTVTTVTTVSNLTTGSVTMTGGTLTLGTLTNLVSGTINAIAAGTITTGTVSVTAGTLSPIPTIGQSTFGTHGTTGVSLVGTLVGGTGSGAGTEIFVTGVSIVIPATAGSQDVSVGFGTNGGTFHSGTGVLARGFFVAGGGLTRTFVPAVNSGTNAQVTYFQAGAGTVSVDITYFTAASTL